MGYAKQIYKSAAAELKARRDRAEAVAAQHKQEFVRVCPAVLDIEGEMAKTGLEAVKAVGAGDNAVKIVQSLAKYNLELQAKRKALLKENGFPQDFLLPAYTCSICNDTGIHNNAPCACYRTLLKELAYQELAKTTPLQLCDFESFSLNAYANTPDTNGIIAQEEMQAIYERCREYAENFTASANSLFFFGATGLGKTHLSLAIADKVIQKGFGVVYGTAQNLLTRLEKERFGKIEDTDTESLLLECDLLILDDLGTEFTTGFTVAAVYNILNTRELSGKPTIINTNLSLSELEEKYTTRISSRILGKYEIYRFIGNDQRIAHRTE